MQASEGENESSQGSSDEEERGASTAPPSVVVATLALGSQPRQGVARKAGSQKEGSPRAKANALEGCRPRGGSPRVITYSRESKEVRGSVRE
jgi:hypothetical protein